MVCMVTSSITENFIIQDADACQKLRNMIEEFEAKVDKKQEIKSGPSVCERGVALLVARYSQRDRVCKAVEELTQESEAIGSAKTLATLVVDGVISKEEAAKRAGMSMEEFAKFLGAAQA